MTQQPILSQLLIMEIRLAADLLRQEAALFLLLLILPAISIINVPSIRKWLPAFMCNRITVHISSLLKSLFSHRQNCEKDIIVLFVSCCFLTCHLKKPLVLFLRNYKK